MRQILMILGALLAVSPATAQEVPIVIKNGIVTVTTAPTGTCDATKAPVLFDTTTGVHWYCSASAWVQAPGGGSGGSPGGSDSQVQYNNAGAFGGDNGLTYNDATGTLNATNFAGDGASVTAVVHTSGNENIAGTKTLTGTVRIEQSGGPTQAFWLKSTSATCSGSPYLVLEGADACTPTYAYQIGVLSDGTLQFYPDSGSADATKLAQSGDWTMPHDVTASTFTGALDCTDCVGLGTETTGNHVAGATTNKGLALTGTEGGTLGLLETCADGELLKWTAASSTWGCATDGGGGGGEANTASNLGGGLASYDSKSGVDLRFNSFAAADFDLVTNLVSIDDTKWAKDSELHGDGANCAAGNYPLGVDATGAVQSCTADDDVPESGDFGAATDLDSAGAIVANAVALGTDTTGNYVAGATANKGLTLTGTEAATLGLLQTCADGELLKWTAGTSTWDCAVDAGGGGGGIATVQESDVTVTSSATVLDFGAGFDLTDSPAGEANVLLDYTEDPVNLATSEVTGILPEANIDALIARDSELHGDGANCTVGNYPLGVDASGAVQSCTTDDDVPDAGDFGAATDLDANGAIVANAVALGTDTTGGYAASTTEGGPATTATALAANGANCAAGNYPLGVDASGAAETCTADDDVPESGDFGAAADLDATGAVSANAIALTTDTTGNYVASATANGGLTMSGTEGGSLGMLTTCASGQVLQYNGTAWACTTPSGGSSAAALWTITLLDPASGTDALNLDAGGDTYIGPAMDSAVTITKVECAVDLGGSGESCSVDIGQFSVGTSVYTDIYAALSADNNGQAATSGWTDNTVPAGDHLVIDINSCTGTISQLVCTIYGS